MSIRKDKWEESYQRHENHIFYPKEECVKFLNRFIRKRVGVDAFVDIYPSSSGAIKALDYGCGLGRNSILLEEFGVETYGVDISATAVHAARNLSTASGFEGLAGRLEVTKGKGLAFNDKQFDFVLCDSVLDSMHFEIAKSLMKEFERVAKNYVFISLISGDDSSHYREFGGEEDVETEHEEGTIQSYFNYSKIEDLVAGTELSLKWGRLVSEESIVDQYKLSRYWLLFEQK